MIGNSEDYQWIECRLCARGAKPLTEEEATLAAAGWGGVLVPQKCISARGWHLAMAADVEPSA